MARFTIILLVLALAAPLSCWLFGQQSDPGGPPPARGKPALIRDDQTQAAPEDAAVIEPDPVKAKKNFEIGLYYLKKKRYDAAMMRFRDAVLYKPDFSEAKWKFVETLAKKLDWQNTLDFANGYLQDPGMASYKDSLISLRDEAGRHLPQAKPIQP